ncbi:hypothetical protein ABT010_25320 [Streptomyces sp. NPDC002668]|uniref:DUF7224 domain-containing protein n=1 Tax=Streptomyces sp. NPDC002668 TaxID=3154422 RepID=UPI003323C77F
MPWIALLRTSGAIWGVIPACAWMWYFTRQPDFLVTNGYWESATAQATLIGVIPVTLCAATGTWEAIRLKRSGLIDTGGGTSERSSLTVAFAQLRVVWCVSAIFVIWSLICVSRWASGALGMPDLRVLALLAGMLWAYALLGYAIGWLLPGLLTVPGVAIGTFLWLSYPAAMEPLWLRQLNGTNLSECCAYDQTLAPRALIIPALVLLGLVGSALLAIAARARRSRLLSVLPLAAATAMAVPLAMPLGFSPSEKRDISALWCTDGAPRVCVWPEQRNAAEKFQTWAQEGAGRLSMAGVKPPKTYMPTSSDPTRSDVLRSLVSAVMPASFPDCHKQGVWSGRSAYFPVGAWLELTAGANRAEVAKRIADGGKALSLVDRVRALPAKDQLNWYQTNHAALTDCSREPRLDPGAYKDGTS